MTAAEGERFGEEQSVRPRTEVEVLQRDHCRFSF